MPVSSRIIAQALVHGHGARWMCRAAVACGVHTLSPARAAGPAQICPPTRARSKPAHGSNRPMGRPALYARHREAAPADPRARARSCDKVYSVPLPFPYAQLLVILLCIYCFTVPFVFIQFFEEPVSPRGPPLTTHPPSPPMGAVAPREIGFHCRAWAPSVAPCRRCPAGPRRAVGRHGPYCAALPAH